jgi:hypothetical protein
MILIFIFPLLRDCVTTYFGRHSGETGCVVMSMDRHSGESRNPGALILKAILDPGFHRGDEKN